MNFVFKNPVGKFIHIRMLGHLVINCIYIVYVSPMMLLFLFGAMLNCGTFEIGGE